MPAIIKIVTLFYIFIIAGIVVLANNKGTRFIIGFGAGIPYFDKFSHFVLTGLFSFLVNLALKARTFSIRTYKILLGTIIVLTVVTLEEFSQIFVNGRAFDWGDLAADYLGIFMFGYLASLVYQRYLAKTSDNR